MTDEVRVRATSLESFEAAIEAAFEQIEPDGPERLATARVDSQTISRGGVVGSTQYHVELVQVPWKRE
jgi:flavin-binding protein dodecin